MTQTYPPPPSRCKLKTYVSIVAACALTKVFALVVALFFASSATAQLVPPLGVRKWQGTGSGLWSNSGNWQGGIPNDNNHHALFGNDATATGSTPEIEVQTNGDRKLKSLWFDAGYWYTISGTNRITINQGENGALVMVNSDGTQQSEINIDSDIKFESVPSPGHIRNYSEGGLRFGGLFLLGDNYIRIGGTGATHIAGPLRGNEPNQNSNGNIEVMGDWTKGDQPHFILSGNNPNWGGFLHAYRGGFAIIKADQALGSQSEKHARFGGTIGFRAHLETPLDYKKPASNNIIQAWEMGIVRTGSTHQIGAIYNDGGYTTLGMRISLTSTPAGQSDTAPLGTDFVGFGSRGDREGGLELTNVINGTGTFVKLGPGLIVLNNALGGGDRNNWDKATELRAGVLRISTANSLPTGSNIIFAGGIHGGILELGYGTTSFDYSLGTGGGNIRWTETGDGGFSAHGAARSVKIDGGTALTWGSTTNFIGDGFALLLSSRYANDVITFENAINLNGGQREVRVARGEDTAHAVLSGELSGEGGGLLKTGDGLLRLTGSNSYTGATRIEAGALRGAVGNGSSNIQLAGGILGLDANFTRGLGGSGNQIRWDGSGGFAAYGSANHSVNIGGANATLTWGTTGGFIGSGQELRFGHHTANRTVLWDNALALGSDERTIRIERGTNASLAVVNFRQAISGTGTLNLLGNGRIDLTADNSALSGTINIYGAELRLHGSGKLGAVGGFNIRNGGRLVLNNTSDNSDANRLNDTANITLAAGTLQLDSATTAISEEIGDLTLESGANAIELSGGVARVELHINKLVRDTGDTSDERATLDVLGDLQFGERLKLSDSASGHEEGGIIPWATVNGSDWVTTETNGSDHYLRLLTSYQTSFGAGNNVKITSSGSFSGNQTINSLNLQGNLSMGGNLTSTGDPRTISGNGSIMTGGILPLYIHTHDNLTFSDTARINVGSNRDIVKTLGGSLIFNNSATTIHQARDLYIHQGTVELRGNGALQVRRITIGDGAGEDRFILPGGVWNPVKGHGSGLPSITLRGTPYDPRGPEYGGAQAILQLGGDGPNYGAGTKQRLANLHIEGRGTIDWRGGEVGQANILWIDELTFSSTSDRLFIRNWYEYEDLFLVKKIHNGQEFDKYLLNQIVFEGYQDYFTTWKDYDKDYYQIYPFGIRPFPEPSTYGAILAAVGIGLWTWRKRRRQKS